MPPVIEQLAELDLVPRATNVVFVGPTGVGKTGLASAILLQALYRGYRGLFVKAQDLFDEMYDPGRPQHPSAAQLTRAPRGAAQRRDGPS